MPVAYHEEEHAGHRCPHRKTPLRHGDELCAEGQAAEQAGFWLHTMLEEFRQVPEEWKPIASDRIRAFVRLSRLRRYGQITGPGWSASHPDPDDQEEEDTHTDAA